MLFTLAALVSLAAIPKSWAAQFSVTVGGPGVLQYNPSTVNANPGDTVIFTFQQKNHTATQSTFASPCTMDQGGFDSGFVPVADNVTSGFPQAQFVVQDTNPVWVYCRQANHCQQGMVFAINPGDKFAAFQAAAMGNSSSNVSSSTAPTSTAPSSVTPPPASGVVTVTATVTLSGQALTTTYGSYPGSAAPTSVLSNDHTVVVGGPSKLFFSPSNISAQAGDTITFQFQQKNHTVTQSSFAQPCLKLAQTSTSGQVGFDSGFMPVADNATTFPTFTIQINDTTPIWAYCAQATHCGQGMVFSVNAIESGANNFAAFQAKAEQINGTSTTSASSPPSSPTQSTSGAGRVDAIKSSGLGRAMVALSAVVFGMGMAL